jgi:hypothetical protein
VKAAVLSLILAGIATVVFAQPSRAAPCGDNPFCLDSTSPHAARLHSAYRSDATTETQRQMMREIINRNTIDRVTDWARASDEYFMWRQRTLNSREPVLYSSQYEASLARERSQAAEREAAAARTTSSRTIRESFDRCAGDLALKNYQQPYSPNDISRSIVGACLVSTIDNFGNEREIMLALAGVRQEERVADIIRELRRPNVRLNR